MANNAYLPNIDELIQAGLDPKTGLPLKLLCADKGAIRRALRVVDECDAIHRYKWNGLPSEIDPQIIERVLYYRGQGIMFYEKNTAKFYFLPFCLVGNIDVYGRYIKVTPLPFNGMQTDMDKGERPWISGLNFKVKYYKEDDSELPADCAGWCVILTDYCKQNSQTVIPRQIIDEPILDIESECIPFLRTALINSTGVKGMRVNGTDEQANVAAANASIHNAALKGESYVPIIGALEFQDLSSKPTGNAADFLQAMQAVDNWRRSTMGYETNGVYEKKAHMLQDEQSMNAGGAGSILGDGLELRQQFCEVANSIAWADGITLNMSVDLGETTAPGANELEPMENTTEFTDKEVSSDDSNN